MYQSQMLQYHSRSPSNTSVLVFYHGFSTEDTKIMDTLILKVQDSAARNSRSQYESMAMEYKYMDDSQSPFKVKPLSFTKTKSPHSPLKDSAINSTHQLKDESISSVTRYSQPVQPSQAGLMSPDSLRSMKATPMSSDWDEVIHSHQYALQPASTEEAQQVSPVSPRPKQQIEPDLTELNFKYMRPELQSTVQNYRPRANTTDLAVRTENRYGPNFVGQSNRKQKSRFSLPTSLKSKSTKFHSYTVSPVNIQPSAQVSPQESTIMRPNSWFGAKLRKPSRPYISLPQPMPKGADRPTLTSVKPQSFLRRHLSSHPTPTLTANYDGRKIEEAEENPASAPILNRPAVVHSEVTRPERPDRSPIRSSRAPFQGFQIDTTKQLSPLEPYLLTYHTTKGQQIAIPTRTLCSISRSASRRSARGYKGRHRGNPATKSQRRQLSSMGRTSAAPGLNVKEPVYSPANSQEVGLWFENADTVCCSSPSDHSSPQFSENENSTAPSSPVGSSEGRGSVDDVRTKVPRKSSTGMNSTITDWDGLGDCTSQFVQQMSSVNEVRRSLSFDRDIQSPSSVYSVKTRRVELRDPAPQAVKPEPRKSTEDPRISGSNPGILNSPPTVQGTKSQMLEKPLVHLPNARKPKPHVSQLIIPPSLYNDVSLHTIYSVKALPQIPSSKPHLVRKDTVKKPHSANPLRRIAETEIRETTPHPSRPTNTIPQMAAIQEPHRPAPPPPLSVVEEDPEDTEAVISPTTHYRPPTTSPTNNKPHTPPTIPARLPHPIETWYTPTFLAPKRGLQLRISRHELSMTRQEWQITTTAATSTPILRCIGETNSISQRREFWDVEGTHLFSFHKAVGSTRIAESAAGQTLFVVRNAGLKVMPHWSLTHKGGREGESVQWVARGDRDCRNLDVLWGGFLAGRISVEGMRSRHTYVVAVNAEMNYCMMAALTMVFDDLRVDEGFF